MKISIENITKKHLIKLEDLPTGSAFRVNNSLYVKTENIEPSENLIQVINIQNMYITYWGKDAYVQPVRICEAEVKYEDIYDEDI